jgi:streptomycin 6-kinase
VLEHLQALPGGAEWLEGLPSLIDECAERWDLELGSPMPGGYCSFVAPAGDAVLKIGWPHEESEHEALALRVWDGDGAVRLLADDPERNALLLERCEPGTPLLDLGDDEAGDVVAALLPRLWKPPPAELRQLEDVAARWVDELPRLWERHGRPFERPLLDAAVGALRELGPTQGPLVLASEDLHAGNVLRSAREPWLVIDPKPIAAEREFTAVAMIRDRKEDVAAGPHPLERVRRRLTRLSSDLDVDRERLRGWTVAHTLVWGFEKPRGFHSAHAEVARLSLRA